MVCVYCGGTTSVTNSRRQRSSFRVWRRRMCSGCSAIFSTLEYPDFQKSITISTARGHIESFQRDKLFISIYESCRHRAEPISDAEALTSTIIKKLLKNTQNGIVQLSDILTISKEVLGRFDNVAAVYYEAYHQEAN